MLASDLGGGEEEQSNQDTLASVEEMLEGYEWATDNVMGGTKTKGTVDQIEARLMDELMALEKVSSTPMFSAYIPDSCPGEHVFVHRV